MRLLGYWSVLHEAAGALGSGWENTQICILRERSDRLAASEASLAVACERSEASVTASLSIYRTDFRWSHSHVRTVRCLYVPFPREIGHLDISV